MGATPSPPRAFISHASEDKERFVVPFAQALRARGIDAWLDKWEMLPGDSLVDKIFEEGIGNANSVVVVVSRHSSSKPWVREELNAAVVKRIEKQAKLIPLVLDEADVPEALRAILWEKVPDPLNFIDVLDRVVNAVLGTAVKRPLGPPPPYTSLPSVVPGLSDVDTRVLMEVGKVAMERGYPHMEVALMLPPLAEDGISESAARDSLEVFDQDGLIELSRVLGGPPPHLVVTHDGLRRYCEAALPSFGKWQRDVVAAVVNDELRSSDEIAERIVAPTLVVKHVLDELASEGYVQLRKAVSGPRRIQSVSAKAKRLLQP